MDPEKLKIQILPFICVLQFTGMKSDLETQLAKNNK